MKCPDCKGSGKYVGARVVEDCRKCNGAGNIVTDDDKEKALKSVAEAQPKMTLGEVEIYEYVKSVGEPGINPFDLAEQCDKVSELKPARNSAKELGLAPCDGINLPEIQVGTIIHVFDGDWYAPEVTHIATCPINGGPGVIYAEDPCNRFRILYTYLAFNLTLYRWEFIKSGTPVYP